MVCYTSTMKFCSLENCDSKHRARGYCAKHYKSRYTISRKPYYYIWANMNGRCYTKTHARYKDWGGRGIEVCDRWRKSYKAFESDIGKRPKSYQLDRIDNDGDYEPKNCRWVPPAKNSAVNRRRVRKDNKSGVPGVLWCKNVRRYQASITINKKRIHLGTFVHKETAIKARKAAEVRYHA